MIFVLDLTKDSNLQLGSQKSCTILQIFHNVIFLLDILSTNITITIILCDYTYGKNILDIVYSGAVTDSANGSSDNKGVSALIGWEGLASLG